MKINRFRGSIAKFGNGLILLCLLLANSSSVQVARAITGDTTYVSVALGDTHILSSSSVKYSKALITDWEKLNFDDSSWQNVVAPSGGICDPSGVTRITNSDALPVWGQDPQVRETIYARKTFSLQNPIATTIKILVDDDFDLYVNDLLVISDWNGTWSYFEEDITLQSGANSIAIKATDWGGCQSIAFDISLGEETLLYTVSGNVGVANASLIYSDGGFPKTAVSGEDGSYSLNVQVVGLVRSHR